MSKDSHTSSSHPPLAMGLPKRRGIDGRRTARNQEGKQAIVVLACQLFAGGSHATQDKDDERCK